MELSGNLNRLRSQADIMNSYNDLYREMRRYIWGFEVVDALADLELSSYQLCPDVNSVRSNYQTLYRLVRDVCREDADLDSAFSKFNDVIDSCDQTYAKLQQVNEVIE